MEDLDEIALSVNALGTIAHIDALNNGWHTDLETGEPKPVDVPERLMLIVSEVSEAMEADRKGLQDVHLPHRKGLEVELGDAVIRIVELCEHLDLDIGGAIIEKIEYNRVREDHKIENRKNNGKKY